MEKTYTLEQGITNPRDGSVNWSPYEVYASAAEAKREARRSRGLWRIVESRVIWEKPQGG